MANDHVIVTGLDEALRRFEALGENVDRMTRVAATEAGNDLRDTFLTRTIGSKTGLSAGVIRRHSKIYPANQRYSGAHIMFSSGGIPVKEYSYTSRTSGVNATRSQIIIDWVTGGQKVAAGFINQYGQRKTPIATRSRRTTLDRLSERVYKINGQAQYKIDGIKEKKQLYGKVHDYDVGKIKDARGPSLATIYKEMSKAEVFREAEIRLAGRLAYYLDFALD
ncbi:MAG: hypothetical protein JKY50_04925 [Oleispira sp.]|nr:hypothetical protein [Oleispira sp.]